MIFSVVSMLRMFSFRLMMLLSTMISKFSCLSESSSSLVSFPPSSLLGSSSFFLISHSDLVSSRKCFSFRYSLAELLSLCKVRFDLNTLWPLTVFKHPVLK